MLLQELRCFQFKNYQQVCLSFAPELNCCIGANGAGKTNLLDAIHYLSLTKSAFNPIDTQNILHDEPQMVIQGSFLKKAQTCEVQCVVHKEQGKTMYSHGKPLDRIRDHIGKFPVVLATPYDTNLIHGGSDVRRRFVDEILCQTDARYLQQRMHYQQLLKHRNSLLKLNAGRSNIDYALLTAYDQQLLPLGKGLYVARKGFMDHFLPRLQENYARFVDAAETIGLQYMSDWDTPDFEQRYHDHLPNDMHLQRTVLGIHRDDFVGTLNGYSLKKFGSQGQQKSFLLALRLAQFAAIYDLLGYKPLLLLDDIFDKLDTQRIERLMYLIEKRHFGQIWMTDAGGKQSEALMQQLQVHKTIFKIEAGAVKVCQ